MNRIIKFRAWDGQKFYTPAIACNVEWNLYDDCEVKGYPLMQFTGLLDHDKKEIYDQDILQDVSGYLWLVFWYDDHACFGLKAIGQNVTVEIIDNHNMKIVGNIYETPDLLKE